MDLKTTLVQDLWPHFQKVMGGASPRALVCVPSLAKHDCDYQLNGFLALSKSERATRLKDFVQEVQHQPPLWLESLEVQAPGFVNLKIRTPWLLNWVLKGLRLPPRARQEKILIDYSSPNVAKAMAVHHMRSTFLGDALARIFEYQGHKVMRVNHIGDWGAQFGMLLAALEERPEVDWKAFHLAELEATYCQAQARCKIDAEFARKARKKVAQLQQHEPQTMALWRHCVDLTLEQNQRLYELLNVTLKPENVCGESTYQPLAEATLKELLQRGLAFEKEGSILSWLEGEKNKSGEPMALVWRTRDGAGLYALTDLACARYRATVTDRALYCTDARQSLHFAQVWAFARKAGYIGAHTSFEHLAFGMLLGPDGAPYKTRSGGTPKLIDFLFEAEAWIEKRWEDKFQGLEGEARQQAIRDLAVNVIKYADLCRHRESNYPFQWEKALAFEGNTAPYLLYAGVRALRLLERAQSAQEERCEVDEVVSADLPIEHRLLLRLAEWEDCLGQVTEKGLPHLLCHYLFQLAEAFSTFYEQCPILGVEPSLRRRRLQWVQLFHQRLSQGLELLGLRPLQAM